MSTAMASQLALNDRFVAAGFPAEQARVMVEAISESREAERETLVTKDFLRAELQTLRTEMQTSTKDLIDRIGKVESGIGKVESSTIRWIIGTQVVLLSGVVALANFTKLL